jgi:hypothetical protein
MRPKMFIASSTEGLKVVKPLQKLLVEKLGQKVEIERWTMKFKLSATYIESLERAARDADFAVMVVTPDDVIRSRGKQQPAPRDNVLFEFGLFMGRIGRERCYLVADETRGLKLPSDLLGLKAASFSRAAGKSWEKVLADACDAITQLVLDLGRGFQWKDMAAQKAVRDFCERIEGPWWELVESPVGRGLSFVWMEREEATNSVRLKGSTFDTKGRQWAKWEGLHARVVCDDSTIWYHWTGTHSRRASEASEGFGETVFEAVTGGGPFRRAHGTFWDINKVHPERTTAKATELRRIDDERTVSIMTEGKGAQVRALASKTLKHW